jgi:phosphoribosylaminoimidazolecarboxamide formyltransferase / IMP cyclohydrolase
MKALLSGYDTTGLVDFAQGLADLGVALVASGGAARALADAGIVHGTIEAMAGSAGRLGRHDDTSAELERPAMAIAAALATFDLIVCNLAPFTMQPSLETIDVDGPALLRAAARSYARVAVVVDPADYEGVLDELRRAGTLSDATRRRLARAAFAHTAAYDAAIVSWLDEGDGAVLPPTLHLALVRAQDLRYGENPHQHGARYRERGRTSWWDDVIQHGGMALSYLNLFDAEAAWQLVHELGEGPAAAVIKHANPCGVAVAGNIEEAYRRAIACDPTSAFGGIVALNRPVSAALAAEVVGSPKADVMVAPGYAPDALALFAAKRKNMRVLEAPPPQRERYDLRRLSGGFLVQEADRITPKSGAWRVVTRAAPTEDQWRDLELAWRICARVTSNAIVFVAAGQAVGVGAGQQSRVDAVDIAARKAHGRARGGACASDAFFPFRDGLDAAARAGVAAVIQPGGSVRDGEVIAAADEHGLAMVVTGERHFKH